MANLPSQSGLGIPNLCHLKMDLQAGPTLLLEFWGATLDPPASVVNVLRTESSPQPWLMNSSLVFLPRLGQVWNVPSLVDIS